MRETSKTSDRLRVSTFPTGQSIGDRKPLRPSFGSRRPLAYINAGPTSPKRLAVNRLAGIAAAAHRLHKPGHTPFKLVTH